MAKMWYPVIDYLTCMECGTCVAFCPHGVYDETKSPSPVVLHPEECMDHCHGCGNKCPTGAITYVGDDTGWVPPQGEKREEIGSSCCCGTKHAKEILVEYLYLDLKTCDRCIGTDAVLDEVVALLTPVLELAGYSVEYRKTEMTSADVARQYHFLSSPTIRVNGQDIFHTVLETSCGCCSEISGTDVACRAYEVGGKTYEVPSKEMLANAVLQSVYAPSDCSCESYALPENLKQFFEGKSKRVSCSCGGNC